MPRFRVLKNSLLGGQVSRDAVGRTDIPQYAHACELLQNMIPLPSGGAYRRPGTIFQDYIPANHATPNFAGDTGQNQMSPPRMFPFIARNGTAFAVAIGTMRWSNLQGVGQNPSDLAGGAYMKAYRATGNTNALIGGTGLINILPYRCKSKNVAVTATDQCIYTRQGGPGAVANSGVNTAGSPVTIIDVADSLQTYDDDIWSVQYCQANDVMFLTHPDYQPQTIYLDTPVLLDAAPYDAGLTTLQLAQSRPYLNMNSTTATMKYTGTVTAGSTGTLTCSTAFFNTLHGPRAACNPESLTAPTDGAIFGIASGEGSDFGVGGMLFMQVLSVTSTTVCSVKVLTAPSGYVSATAVPEWWESAWSNYRGWPRACAIYQQRLAMAGTIHQPNAIWFTAIGAFGASGSSLVTACKFTALNDGPTQGILAGATGTLANGRDYTTPKNWVYYPVDDAQGDGQSTGPLGSQPFRISLATTSLDAIQYMSADQQLFIGTAVQEWIVAPQNGAFDVANSEATIQSHYGSDLVQAIRIGYEMMFVDQSKSQVKAYQYNYYDQSFFGEPVQLFFDEYPEDEESTTTNPNLFVGRRKIRQMDWDASRSTLWCVDTAGSFFGLTRDRKLQITAWHTHQLGGFNTAHGSGQNITDNLTAGNYYTDSANYLCDGSVVSVCTVPNPLSGIRDVWMVVKRSYGNTNNTTWSIERIVGGNTVRQSAYSAVAPGNAQEPLYTDCSYFLTDHGDPGNLAYTVGSADSNPLYNQQLVGTYYSQAWGMFALTTQSPVNVNAAFLLQSDLPPDYGDLTKAHTIVVGLPYSSIVMPVRIDPPSPVGTSQGAIKRISKAYIRLFKTLMLKAGTISNLGATPSLSTVLFKPAASLAQSPEIFTGDKEVFIPSDFDRNGYLYILQDQPLPFTLVSISAEGMEYEQ